MNAKKIFDQLMKQAVDSKTGHQRPQGHKSSAADLKTLLGSGGALSMLMGSRRGRGTGGKALKYGAIAKVGMLAWNAWQDHKSSSQSSDPAKEGQPFEQLQGTAQEGRSLELLQAMIMAARADGHIDESERAEIAGHIETLGADDDLKAWVDRQFKAPLDASLLARQVDSPQGAREMYLVSAAMTDDENPMERAWLDQLAKALDIEAGLAAQLERQAAAAATA